MAAGNLAFIPTFAHIGGFMGAFADPEEGSFQSVELHSPYDEHGPAMGTQPGTDTTQVVQLGTAMVQHGTTMSTGLTGLVAGLTASTATRFEEQNFSATTQGSTAWYSHGTA